MLPGRLLPEVPPLALGRAWMMLTPVVKLHVMALLEANQKQTPESTGRKRPVMRT